jgi:hypothetical protein
MSLCLCLLIVSAVDTTIVQVTGFTTALYIQTEELVRPKS